MIAVDPLKVVFVLELFYAATAVDEFLLAGIEGMAGRADIESDLFLHGLCFPRIAAGTSHLRVFVFGMYSFFHHSSFL
jgi:hypothetical protein